MPEPMNPLGDVPEKLYQEHEDREFSLALAKSEVTRVNAASYSDNAQRDLEHTQAANNLARASELATHVIDAAKEHHEENLPAYKAEALEDMEAKHKSVLV